MAQKLSNMYLSSFCLEVAMLLQAGMTARFGVQVMADEEKDAALNALLNKLEKGASLSEAVRGAGCFPGYMASMLEIGEKTGRLPETLRALAEHYERRERLVKTVRSAALYPAVLLGLMIVVVFVLIVRILPIFNDVFGRMGAQMSPLAVRLMNFGIFFRGASLFIAIAASVFFAAAFLVWAVPGMREGLLKRLKNTWGESGIFGRIAAFQFVSGMAASLSSGLSIEEAVTLSASLNNDSSLAKYEKCVGFIESGSNLTDALRASEILSARDGRLLSLGERGGMADFAMAEIARRKDADIQDEIAGIVSKIEPSIVIVTSVIVGIILLSVMLPLIGIMSSIGAR